MRFHTQMQMSPKKKKKLLSRYLHVRVTHMDRDEVRLNQGLELL